MFGILPQTTQIITTNFPCPLWMICHDLLGSFLFTINLMSLMFLVFLQQIENFVKEVSQSLMLSGSTILAQEEALVTE